MKVLLIGGIFGQAESFRRKNLQVTTETILAQYLPDCGIEVATAAPAVNNSISGFDVIHAHHLANHCLKLQVQFHTPVVFTRHAHGAVPLLHRPVLWGMEKRADAIVALSDRQANELATRFSPGKIARIYNGVDETRFKGTTRVPPVLSEDWNILYVGQLIELKRVHLAIEMIRFLLDRGIKAILSIATHRNTLEGELKALAASLEVDERVHFLGPMGQDDIADRMRDAHALVLPSRTEALPTVVSEAVISALPVLCFDVGGVREQLPPGERPPAVSDIDGFFKSAERLFSGYQQSAARYARFSDVAADRFSVSKMVAEHADLYRSLSGCGW